MSYPVPPVACTCTACKGFERPHKLVASAPLPPISPSLGKGLPGIEHAPKMIGRLLQDRTAVAARARTQALARRQREAAELAAKKAEPKKTP